MKVRVGSEVLTLTLAHSHFVDEGRGMRKSN
jgi:hypothetical protein